MSAPLSTITARSTLTETLALQLHDYWREVDARHGREAHLFYTEDAVFEIPPLARHVGRDAIAAFYAGREARGPRTALHVVSNFRAVPMGAHEAEATWILQLFAADGTPPHACTAPILVAAMTDRHRLEPQGWRCAHRRFETLFQSAAPVVGAAEDPAHG